MQSYPNYLFACVALLPMLVSCNHRKTQDPERELTRSSLVSYPEEPDLPRAAIARLGNKNLHLDGKIRAMTLDPIERFLIASDGGQLEIFEPDTGLKERAILPNIKKNPSDMEVLNFAQSGKHLIGLTNESSRKLMVWSMPERSLLYSLPSEKVFSDIITTASAKPHFATISTSQDLLIHNLQDHKVLLEKKLSQPARGYRSLYTAIYYTPDDSHILLLRRDGWELRDATTGDITRNVTNQSTYISAAFLPQQNKIVLVQSAGHNVEIWDQQQGSLLNSIPFANTIRRISKIAIDPTTNTILVQTVGNSPALLGLHPEKGELFRIRSHDFAVSDEGLIAISLGRSIRRYRIDKKGNLAIIERVAGHASAPTQFAWDDAGDTLWSASPEGTLIRWNIQDNTGEFFEDNLLPGEIAFALDPHSSGMVIAATTRTKNGAKPIIKWVDRTTKDTLWQHELDHSLQHVSILENGDILAMSSHGIVQKFNPYGAPIDRWPLGSSTSTLVMRNQRMSRATIYEPHIQKARFWDLDTGYLMGERRFSGQIQCAWYRDFTAACARQHGVGSVSLGSLWYPSEVTSFSHGFQHVRGMGFTHLGDRLAVWGERPSRFDHADQLWLFDADLSNDDPMLPPLLIEPHDGKIISTIFHPDSRRLATGHDSGLIYLWDLGQAKSIELR